MVEPYTWGSLARANNDPTVIDEAIATAIDAHKADPDAHLGDDESLQSHRASEIIDHRAESVVNDKIRFGARTYAAIVGTEEGDDYDNIEDAIDFVRSKGTGSIYIRAGNYTPTRPLKVTYGIDLYGEGPGETVINLDSAGKKYLNYAQLYQLTVLPIPTIYTYTDSDVVDVVMPSGISSAALADMYVILDFVEGYFYPGAPEGQAYLPDVATGDFELTDVVVQPSLYASVASDIVHINGWELCDNFEDFIGEFLICDGGDIGIVEDYLGNGDFKLVANSISDVARSIGITTYSQYVKLSVLQGVSIDFNGNDYGFIIAPYGPRLYVRDCAFLDCGGLFKTDAYLNTLSAGGVTVEDTNIYCTAADTNLDISGAVFRACTFYFASGASAVALGGIYSRFDDCGFTTTDFIDRDVLQNVQRYARFNNCTFNRMTTGLVGNQASSWGATHDMYNIFSDCVFLRQTASTLYFKGYAISVVGCFFQGNETTVGLDSASRYCVFSGNIGGSGIASTPTNCQVGLNQTT